MCVVLRENQLEMAEMVVILAALLLTVGAFATFIACAIRDQWNDADDARSPRNELRSTKDQAGPSRRAPESLPQYPLPDRYRGNEETADHARIRRSPAGSSNPTLRLSRSAIHDTA